MSVTEAVIKKRSETESANRISLTFQLKNVSDVGVFVLSSQVLYCFRAPDDDMNYSMDQLYSDTDHCSHGQILGDRSVTEANTSTVYHTALSVPKDRSLFQLFVRAYYGRNDRLRADFDTTNVDDAQKADCKPGPHIGTYRLSNESRIKGLVQRPRYVTYQGEKDGATYYAITAKGEPLCVSNNDLWRYYGIQWVYSYQQEWVPAK